jgi:hypothetical protein
MDEWVQSRLLSAVAVGHYTCAMIDLFSVPVGTVPQEDLEDGVDDSLPFPPEINDHRGKWVAIRGSEMIAVRDTERELFDEFGLLHPGITFFRVPTSDVAAR